MIIRLYIRVKNAGLTGGKNGRGRVLNLMSPNLQVLMTVEQNLYSVIHPVIRKVLKVIFSKAPMASGLLLWLPTAQADPSELEP